MHGLEWVFSIVLSVVFLITGVNRAFRYEKSRDLFTWVKDVPRALVQAIGIAEILSALQRVPIGFLPMRTAPKQCLTVW